MEQISSIHVSELCATVHGFDEYHYCRGNNARRKSRFGLIEEGEGVYIYLNKRLYVHKGDIIFIPEGVYCYSEWSGEPTIKVTYINCFMHYNASPYEYVPQKLICSMDVWDSLMQVSRLLDGNLTNELEAYSLFYAVLKKVIPNMHKRQLPVDKTLQQAIAYITENWDKDFSIDAVAKACCVSESKLYQIFRDQLGETPVHFLNSIRINNAIDYLESTEYSISRISEMVGFRSENHFRKVFCDITGTTPLKFRKGKF